jgi:hypothetical protein
VIDARPAGEVADARRGNKDASLVVAQQQTPYLPLVGRSDDPFGGVELGGKRSTSEVVAYMQSASPHQGAERRSASTLPMMKQSLRASPRRKPGSSFSFLRSARAGYRLSPI